MKTSVELIEQSKKWIPGGVNSPVRAFGAVGGDPIVMARAQGSRLYDVQGKAYIDYVNSWGPMILGHQDPQVIDALHWALDQAVSFGAPCRQELELAQKICQLLPHAEKIRMVNSGTEATMTALRLARGFTERKKIIKFEGCYHGHSDSLLIKAGSGALTFGSPSSPGVLDDIVAHTLVLPFNDLNALEQCFATHSKDIAGVIVEPIAGNMGCIPPVDGFLEGIQQLCQTAGALMIVDEVMTGFRVALGGACEKYQLKPDLVTLGKIIGGGMPVGAIAGRRDVMDKLSPCGPIYQAGTLSGNPLAMTCGLETLKKIQQPNFYKILEEKTQTLALGLLERAQIHQVPLVVNFVPGMFSVFFSDAPKVETFRDVCESDIQRFTTFFHGMLEQGIYLPPSAYESCFVSIVHDTIDIENTLKAADQVFSML